MKVAIVAQPYDGVFPPQQNSVGLIQYHTCRLLSADHDVHLVVKRRSRQFVPENLPFTVHQIDSAADDRLHGAVSRHPRWAARFRLDGTTNWFPSYQSKLAALMKELEPDIIHIPNYWRWSGRLHRAAPSARIVLEMHCEWLSQENRGRVMRQLRNVAAVAGVSRHIVELAEARCTGYAGTYATLFNGVDTDEFKPAPSVPRDESVLFVGRVSPEKGIHTLVEAFARVQDEFPRLVLNIAGPRSVTVEKLLVGLSDDPLVSALSRFYRVDYQEAIERLISAHGLGGRVNFLGRLAHRDLVEHYQHCRLVVNPSLSESFGLACIEAMSMERPVVATCVGGMKEIVDHGTTGFLVPPENPRALADAMRSALDEQKGAELGRAGRERAERMFSWEARVARLRELYLRVSAA